MAWNEPGGGNGKDPWSGKGRDQGPPDLDEVVRKLQEKLGSLFGGGKGSGGGSGTGGSAASGPGNAGMGLIIAIVLVAVIAWKGFYIIEPAERGVVLRFGAYQEIVQPGPHLLIPFVDEVIKVNVDQVSSFGHGAQMLTQDENIVDVKLTVQSRVQDPADFLFQDGDPNQTMQDATETALREIIGRSRLDVIITENRSAIADAVKQNIQATINMYRTGLEITSINIQDAAPPEQVKSAFDDANKAREDKVRIENQAQAYANDVIPKARGAAARQVEDAKAYQGRVIAEAEGEAHRFLAVLGEYEKAPEVTRERLYLETTEKVLGDVNKVIMDVQKGNSLMYLPLDKLIKPAHSDEDTALAPPGLLNAVPSRATTDGPLREDVRGRRAR